MLSGDTRVGQAESRAFHAECALFAEIIVDGTPEQCREERIDDGLLDGAHLRARPGDGALQMLPFALQQHGEAGKGGLGKLLCDVGEGSDATCPPIDLRGDPLTEGFVVADKFPHVSCATRKADG